MENKLKKQMTSRHITMLALGGAIGAGLFKGSGSAIGIAGPAVLLAFLLGGLVLYIVMRGMGQLVLSKGHKGHGGMSGLIEPILGDRTADFIDWLYWSMWIVNIIAEAVALASFMQLWFPNIPVWFFVLVLAVLTTAINLYSVRLFAETEYWLALAKIAVIVLLIIFGFYIVADQAIAKGFFPTIAQMSSHGGFAPFGIKGIISSLLVVIYSYGGTELIAVTISEAENPKVAIPKAIHGVMTRIVSFYLIPLTLLLIIYPWNSLASSNVSPFVMVFEKIGIPFAGDIVNFVIILALFSSINSGVYASSRTLYFRLNSRTSQGKLAKALSSLSSHHVPRNAVLFCTSTLYIGVVISYFLGEKLFGYLVGSLSYTVLIIWILLSLSAFILAKSEKDSLNTLLNGLAVFSLFLIFIGIVFTNNWIITILTACMYLVMIFSYKKKESIE